MHNGEIILFVVLLVIALFVVILLFSLPSEHQVTLSYPLIEISSYVRGTLTEYSSIGITLSYRSGNELPDFSKYLPSVPTLFVHESELYIAPEQGDRRILPLSFFQSPFRLCEELFQKITIYHSIQGRVLSISLTDTLRTKIKYRR